MNCESYRDRVFEFLQGDLRDREGFEAHRGSCGSCAELLRGFEHNERVLAAARVPTAPAELWTSIAQSLSRDRVVPFRRPRVGAFVAAAAALLLALTSLVSVRPAPAPRLKLVVQDVAPESRGAFRTLVPRYEDVDAATAMVDTLYRSDY